MQQAKLSGYPSLPLDSPVLEQQVPAITPPGQQHPCARASLHAVIPLYTYWDVDDDGSATIDASEDDIDRTNVIGYYCFDCHEHFSADEERDDPWQAALSHLQVQCEHPRFTDTPDGNDRCTACGLVVETVKGVIV